MPTRAWIRGSRAWGVRLWCRRSSCCPPHRAKGSVINLAQLRVFYYPKVKEGETPVVITHPIGIGKVGWSTPEGTTKVKSKTKNPTWFPPSSVRKEHKKLGDPLPSKVPPGPDNPLGTHMMTLGWPSYLIHGTNKPYGVGMRSSHGCIRFYPEDIALLYDAIPVGTKVHVVNQPFVFGWQSDALYVQAFPVLEDDERDHPKAADALLNAAISDDDVGESKAARCRGRSRDRQCDRRQASWYCDAGVEGQAHGGQAISQRRATSRIVCRKARPGTARTSCS